MRGARRWRLQSACGRGGGRGARGGRAAGRHFSVLEEPRYTSVSGGCSLADSVASVSRRPARPLPAALTAPRAARLRWHLALRVPTSLINTVITTRCTPIVERPAGHLVRQSQSIIVCKQKLHSLVLDFHKRISF